MIPIRNWTTGAADGELLRYELRDIAETDSFVAAAKGCLAELQPLLERSDRSTIIKELGRLSAGTKTRKEDPVDGSMRAAVFMDCLAPYPADVVIWACRNWLESEVFFPSYAELRQLCERRVKRRRMLAAFCLTAVR